MEQIELIVAGVANQAPGIVAFELRSANGEELPAFDAGAHLDVFLGNGLIRQYSLCNGPDCKDHYLIGVKEEPESRGGSKWMHQSLKRGDVIRTSAPKNNFPLKKGAEHYVLLAGGIGITPILSMARHLAAWGASFELHLFVRSEEHVPFSEVIHSVTKGQQLRLHYGLSPEQTQSVLGTTLAAPRPGSQLYMCGPGVFMDLAVKLAAEAAWPADHVHLERFSAEALPIIAGDSFVVKLARSGRVIEIPADKPITAVLAENGVDIPTSCEAGVCGTCLTNVVSGIPEHLDMYLSDEERSSNTSICPCVSRSLTPVLELDL